MLGALRALSPLGGLLLLYAAAQLINRGPASDQRAGVRNLLGVPLHVIEPAIADQAVFGVLPSYWLQTGWRADPSPHWWDAATAVIYVSHFVVIPVATITVWWKARSRFRRWVVAVLVMTAAGMFVYVAYPMAPPWMAAQQGLTPPVARISGLGWDYMHLSFLKSVVGGAQSASNPVAAMPSLHAAGAALLLLFCWSLFRWPARAAVLSYGVLTGLVVVYTGEHYVVDVVGGWAVAAIGMGVAVRADRPQSVSSDT